MRPQSCARLGLLLLPAIVVALPDIAASAGHGPTLVLTPRTDRLARPQVEQLARGLARAAERFGDTAPFLDADLATATPGELVSRCPARISTNCLAEAARRLGAARTMTGIVKQSGEGYALQLRVVDGTTAETFAVRNVRLFPARGDTLDMAVAGECIGLDLLWSSIGRDGALAEPICGDRVFPTSWSDREHYASSIGADVEDLWLTVVPDATARKAYLEENGLVAGAFASSTAVAVVGTATAVLLGVQTALTNGEAVALAEDNPHAFTVSGARVSVIDEADNSAIRYRDLESRARLEMLASLGATLTAAAAAVGAVAFFQLADIPGRYEAYYGFVAEEVMEESGEGGAS